jgi:hypothetical protein
MISTTPAPERYTRFSCPNPHCARFNRPGDGNIVHRSWTGTHKHIERLRCTVCDQEFSEREGTLMARSKLSEETVIRLLKCQRWGVCDEPAHRGRKCTFVQPLRCSRALLQVSAKGLRRARCSSCVQFPALRVHRLCRCFLLRLRIHQILL